MPWVAAETDYGLELGLKWIKSDKETAASAGRGTLAYYAAVREDEMLDTRVYLQLLDTVKEEIHDGRNRVRYAMNGFVIAVGTYVEALTEKSKEIAKEIGKVSVDMGGTASKVPLANEYNGQAYSSYITTSDIPILHLMFPTKEALGPSKSDTHKHS